mmetsp:Transcript_38895/g.121902  ORF Transcript_38895/g.121902 Transcript_38895/m.121902 type:complete len:463 (-) Transcript_38895:95-1483(-)
MSLVVSPHAPLVVIRLGAPAARCVRLHRLRAPLGSAPRSRRRLRGGLGGLLLLLVVPVVLVPLGLAARARGAAPPAAVGPERAAAPRRARRARHVLHVARLAQQRQRVVFERALREPERRQLVPWAHLERAPVVLRRLLPVAHAAVHASAVAITLWPRRALDGGVGVLQRHPPVLRDGVGAGAAQEVPEVPLVEVDAGGVVVDGGVDALEADVHVAAHAQPRDAPGVLLAERVEVLERVEPLLHLAARRGAELEAPVLELVRLLRGEQDGAVLVALLVLREVEANLRADPVRAHAPGVVAQGLPRVLHRLLGLLRHARLRLVRELLPQQAQALLDAELRRDGLGLHLPREALHAHRRRRPRGLRLRVDAPAPLQALQLALRRREGAQLLAVELRRRLALHGDAHLACGARRKPAWGCGGVFALAVPTASPAHHAPTPTPAAAPASRRKLGATPLCGSMKTTR